jgi:nickel/cobalt transporter (NiCoT) family protein
MSAHPASPNAPSLARRARAALTPREWRRVAGLATVVVALHAVGFFVLLVLVAPRGLPAFGVGIGLTAYMLGVRHAFDADHVGAIDATTRKLMADGRRPLGVGFCFSLGHATVVFALVALLALGVRGLSGEVGDGSWLQQASGVVGPLVSGSFLLSIGLLNLLILVGVARAARRLRHGECDAAELARQPAGGAMARVYGRATRTVTRSWHAYPLGLLFGLGFDTATEVALLVLAGGAALSDLPFHAILCLPVLFAAGMSLFDTLDGMLMRFAYGWAFAMPARRVYYNLTVTGLSVVVALTIGGIELLSALGGTLDLDGGIWSFVATLDLDVVGFAVVGLFVLTWALALAIWRFGGIERRWTWIESPPGEAY